MKRILCLSVLASTSLFSQSYPGLLNDNYSGVHSVLNNPANIVDSRYRLDINLVGLSTHASNDYATLDFMKLFKKLKAGDKYDFDKDSKKYPTSNNNAIVNLDVFGPSFMMNILPKHSIAISTRVRGLVNVNDVNGEVGDFLEDGFNSEKRYEVNALNIHSRANVWGEVGLSYATVLMDKGEHFLKGGLTLKYLQGLGYGRANVTGAYFKYDAGATDKQIDNSLTTRGELNYGYTNNFDEKNREVKILDNSTGFGVDFGFTYEWRPELDKYKYSTNNQTAYYRDVNKYKLRFGLSITDIGRIKYQDAEQTTYDANRVIDYVRYQEAEKKDGLKEKLDYLLGSPVTEKSITAPLPTALHLNGDWNINQKFYLNLDANLNISSDKKGGTRIENTYSLTPRFETKWLSVYLPIGMYEYSGFQTGFGFRAGPLYVGSGSIVTNLLSSESKAADVYVGLKVPIYQSRPKDSDGDGVYDKVDECPKEAGPKENNGCPWGDTDGDGVLDNVDKCPTEAGPKENNGCPWGDADNDGILDNEDKCPTEAGPKENNGCPWGDKDGDGILDNVDRCPEVPGVKEEQGCPEKVVEIITVEAEKNIGQYAKSIYFNTGKSTFRQGVTGKLDMIVDVMNEYPNAKFNIEGYTDSQGNAKFNQRLSESRAKAVKDYLISKGISSDRLHSVGYGEENPIDTNATAAGRANNRRVEVKVRK